MKLTRASPCQRNGCGAAAGSKETAAGLLHVTRQCMPYKGVRRSCIAAFHTHVSASTSAVQPAASAALQNTPPNSPVPQRAPVLQQQTRSRLDSRVPSTAACLGARRLFSLLASAMLLGITCAVTPMPGILAGTLLLAVVAIMEAFWRGLLPRAQQSVLVDKAATEQGPSSTAEAAVGKALRAARAGHLQPLSKTPAEVHAWLRTATMDFWGALWQPFMDFREEWQEAMAQCGPYAWAYDASSTSVDHLSTCFTGVQAFADPDTGAIRAVEADVLLDTESSPHPGSVSMQVLARGPIGKYGFKLKAARVQGRVHLVPVPQCGLLLVEYLGAPSVKTEFETNYPRWLPHDRTKLQQVSTIRRMLQETLEGVLGTPDVICLQQPNQFPASLQYALGAAVRAAASWLANSRDQCIKAISTQHVSTRNANQHSSTPSAQQEDHQAHSADLGGSSGPAAEAAMQEELHHVPTRHSTFAAAAAAAPSTCRTASAASSDNARPTSRHVSSDGLTTAQQSMRQQQQVQVGPPRSTASAIQGSRQGAAARTGTGSHKTNSNSSSSSSRSSSNSTQPAASSTSNSNWRLSSAVSESLECWSPVGVTARLSAGAAASTAGSLSGDPNSTTVASAAAPAGTPDSCLQPEAAKLGSSCLPHVPVHGLPALAGRHGTGAHQTCRTALHLCTALELQDSAPASSTPCDSRLWEDTLQSSSTERRGLAVVCQRAGPSSSDVQHAPHSNLSAAVSTAGAYSKCSSSSSMSTTLRARHIQPSALSSAARALCTEAAGSSNAGISLPGGAAATAVAAFRFQ